MFLCLASMGFLSRNTKAYILFERYDLWGILFLMILEGNIEEIVFYLSGELSLLFSFSTYHQTLNTVLINLLFVVVLFSVGSFFILRYHYRQRVKLFLEHHIFSTIGICAATIDRGLFYVLLGLAHRLLL